MTIGDEVEAALRQLTPREEHVLRLRFRIDSIADVAVRLSLAPAEVRRIIWSAVQKLWLAAVMEARSERANAG